MTRKVSSEYKKLQPYVVEDARSVANAVLAGAASGGSGGGMQKHALDGAYHSGQLAQAQASWAATKVELANHAALPDVHHAKLHSITDAANHSVTGSQYQIVGLTAVNTLGLLTPSATPAANAVVKTDGSSGVTLVDLTVTSDLFMSGYLDFGTDVMYEDASYLQVTGSKAVRFGQNIGNANWTIYNTGGASFGGNVDIVSGGDLTVAGSGAYAGNQVLFADSSGGNVGIMRAPDSQFALDINGPARATYWIGPHAIQLKGVLLLAHYDGRAPYATNLSGEPNGHMGQVATVAGGVIYRPGKFYKAAQFGLATTNLITNPTFANASYLAGWTSYNSPTTVASTQAYIGSNGAYVQSAGAGAIGFSLTGLTPGTWYTASVYIASSSTFPTPYLCNASFGGVANATLQTTTDDGWRRYVAYKQAEADGTLRFILPGTSGGVVYSNAQIERSAYVTPWCSGALGDGHAWTGTANASTSTRAAATLDYPAAGNIFAGAGTIMAWVWVDQLDVSTNTHAIVDAGTAYNYCALFMNSGTTPTGHIGGAGGTVTATGPAAAGVAQWVHVALTWGGGAVTCYTNGVAGTPVAYSNAPTFHTAISVGYYRNLGNRQLNGYIDDLCILERAMPAAEIRSVYESNAPVFAETSTFSFRPTPKGLIWADDEGLWMRDTAGKPVLGVYGGEAATKNWGGFNLVPGDLLLGNNAVGSSAIWWSRVSGKFGFYGAGSGTPQVEIATDGRLTAGGGKVSLDSTGFKAYNAALVETININADGIYMGDGGARTTIASWTSGGRMQFYSVGEIYEATPEDYLDDSSVNRTLYPLVVRAIRQANNAALIELAAVRSDTGAGAKIIIGEGFRLKGYFVGDASGWNTNRVVHAMADDIILQSTNLQLSGQTTSAAAVGTYAGKIKVRINGTNYYIPYYAS